MFKNNLFFEVNVIKFTMLGQIVFYKIKAASAETALLILKLKWLYNSCCLRKFIYYFFYRFNNIISVG